MTAASIIEGIMKTDVIMSAMEKNQFLQLKVMAGKENWETRSSQERG